MNNSVKMTGDARMTCTTVNYNWFNSLINEIAAS